MKLSPERVRQVRDRLGLTRDELAAKLDVSLDAIKKWEGDRGCSGPSRLVLLLMERHPNILDVLGEPPEHLPRADAIPGSPEWFQLQRLLGIVGQPQGIQYWAAVCDEENLTADWLHSMERAELLRPLRQNPPIRCATELAYRRYKLREWQAWAFKDGPRDTTGIPPMTPELLRE